VLDGMGSTKNYSSLGLTTEKLFVPNVLPHENYSSSVSIDLCRQTIGKRIQKKPTEGLLQIH
jgi:hypothetical protein